MKIKARLISREPLSLSFSLSLSRRIGFFSARKSGMEKTLGKNGRSRCGGKEAEIEEEEEEERGKCEEKSVFMRERLME